jgi:hypothetical protein
MVKQIKKREKKKKLNVLVVFILNMVNFTTWTEHENKCKSAVKKFKLFPKIKVKQILLDHAIFYSFKKQGY